MHDPMSVAFEVCWPWKRRSGKSEYFDRPPIVTVWHVDPEVFGDDDSCMKANLYRTNIEAGLGEGSFWNETEEIGILRHRREILAATRWINRVIPWRLHFWHWKIRIHPIQHLKRWLFSRCAGCGKRMPWGYSPVCTSWGGGGPRWGRGEKNIYHHECTHYAERGQKTPPAVSPGAGRGES